MAQSAVRDWANGNCINGSKPLATLEMGILVAFADRYNTTSLKGNVTAFPHVPKLAARSTCRTGQVIATDRGCFDLADRCGISSNDLQKYNSRSDFCTTLKVGQYFCCSPGDLPDMTPQPNSDGSCKSYSVTSVDSCWSIANAFGITQDALESFNKNTWGWSGCSPLMNGLNICISKGTPPMPAAVAGTTCGPQVPGTKQPTDGTPIAELNPCPLNACCDVWGFCGTTADFCTKTPADNGNPGTTQPGTASCISNCGVDLVNNSQGPKVFERIGYFEAFNIERPCLFMDAANIPTDK